VPRRATRTRPSRSLSPPPIDTFYSEQDIEFLERVWRAAERMRPGAILIITTHEMPGRLFELVHEGMVAASWGEASARVYRRLPLPRWVAGVVGRRATGGTRTSASPTNA
jgi:hypothetical protein